MRPSRLLKNGVVALVLSSISACSSSSTRPHLTVTAPTIWLQKSASIDATKLPPCDQCYNSVTDGASPKKGYVFVCDPLAYQQPNGPGGSGGPWIDQANKTFDFTARPRATAFPSTRRRGSTQWPRAIRLANTI